MPSLIVVQPPSVETEGGDPQIGRATFNLAVAEQVQVVSQACQGKGTMILHSVAWRARTTAEKIATRLRKKARQIDHLQAQSQVVSGSTKVLEHIDDVWRVLKRALRTCEVLVFVDVLMAKEIIAKCVRELHIRRSVPSSEGTVVQFELSDSGGEVTFLRQEVSQ